MTGVSEPTIVCLQSEHIEDALELCRLAGWNQMRSEWERLIAYEPQGCFAAIHRGKAIGTVTSTSYGIEMAWIGMMLVHPDFRRQGLATKLMRASLEYLRAKGVGCIRLDATPLGEPVYRRLGFEAEWPFERWQRGSGTRSEIRTQSDTGELVLDAALLAMDRRAFGADRARLLKLLSKTSLGVRTLESFGMLQHGHLADYIGPVSATSRYDAEEIIEQLCASSRRTIFWDVPSKNPQAIDLAHRLRFEPCRHLVRMRTGPSEIHPDLSLQYAIADPGLG